MLVRLLICDLSGLERVEGAGRGGAEGSEDRPRYDVIKPPRGARAREILPYRVYRAPHRAPPPPYPALDPPRPSLVALFYPPLTEKQ